jgi:methylated-DNA-protein-cysteine methyltransferase-like protein
MPRAFEEEVMKVIKAIPAGRVSSYGEVALDAGFPGAARAVGNLLATSEGLPWWRVVRADGSLSARNRSEQAQRLRAEGVKIWNGKVRL